MVALVTVVAAGFGSVARAQELGFVPNPLCPQETGNPEDQEGVVSQAVSIDSNKPPREREHHVVSQHGHSAALVGSRRYSRVVRGVSEREAFTGRALRKSRRA